MCCIKSKTGTCIHLSNSDFKKTSLSKLKYYITHFSANKLTNLLDFFQNITYMNKKKTFDVSLS